MTWEHMWMRFNPLPAARNRGWLQSSHEDTVGKGWWAGSSRYGREDPQL